MTVVAAGNVLTALQPSLRMNPGRPRKTPGWMALMGVWLNQGLGQTSPSSAGVEN
uniref:Uncharacterized protein P0406D01.106 n=1 Tax=Oryza sativa subsp. japonica TaxID=39947 RepID=Q69PQ6_ORYSJ|nr:hypothetical protein [Oryza sativa Japonica Group]